MLNMFQMIWLNNNQVRLGVGGQDKKKKIDNTLTGLTGSQVGLTGALIGLTGVHTDLTGVSCKFGNSSKTKKKMRPSFKELLAKYEKKGAVQKLKEPSNKVKDTKPSSER